MFDSTVAMLACVAICVAGIAAGVMTRERSFVYLLLSARRAELVERYDKLRHTLDTWQG